LCIQAEEIWHAEDSAVDFRNVGVRICSADGEFSSRGIERASWWCTLIAALLGPEAAIVSLASVLTVQCLVFADGGLLALGINVFNMGIVPAVLFAVVLKVLGGVVDEKRRRITAAVITSYIAIVAGAALVPFEISYAKVSIPFEAFLGWMIGIHALIGIGEVVITTYRGGRFVQGTA